MNLSPEDSRLLVELCEQHGVGLRYKSVFGGDLKARHSKAQRTEAAIGCHILNRMAELGRPSSYALGR